MKKIFCSGFWIFCECRHKWNGFRSFWLTSTGPGPKLLDGNISLKLFIGN